MFDRGAAHRSKILYAFAYGASICYNTRRAISFSPKAKTPHHFLFFISYLLFVYLLFFLISIALAFFLANSSKLLWATSSPNSLAIFKCFSDNS